MRKTIDQGVLGREDHIRLHRDLYQNKPTKRLPSLVFGACLLATSCTDSPPPQPTHPIFLTPPQNFIRFTRNGSSTSISIAEDQLLLAFRPEVTEASRSGILNWLTARGAVLTGRVPGTLEYLQYQIRHGDNLNTVLDYLERRPEVSIALPNQEIFPLLDPAPNPIDPTPGTGRYHNLQVGSWWIDQIGLREAWEQTTGSSAIQIGIVDTGIAIGSGHFSGKTIRMGAACRGPEGRVYYEAIPSASVDCTSYSPDFHGTSVASVAAARGDDGIGSVGVAWQNPIISIDLVNLRQTELDLNAAILLAIRMGAKVINVSRGPGCGASAPTCTQDQMAEFRLGILPAILEARARNVLVIFAAGNTGFKRDDRWLPLNRSATEVSAFQSNTIIVGGTDDWDNPQCAEDYVQVPLLEEVFRLYNACLCPSPFDVSLGHYFTFEGAVVELAAPSYRIAVPEISRTDGTTTITHEGQVLVGTSYSAPMVAGAAALVWGQHPTWTALQVKQRLLNTAVVLGAGLSVTVSSTSLPLSELRPQ